MKFHADRRETTRFSLLESHSSEPEGGDCVGSVAPNLVLTHLFSPVLTCLTPSGVQVGAFPQHSSENRILVLTGGKSPIADMVPVRLFVFSI